MREKRPNPKQVSATRESMLQWNRADWGVNHRGSELSDIANVFSASPSQLFLSLPVFSSSSCFFLPSLRWDSYEQHLFPFGHVSAQRQRGKKMIARRTTGPFLVPPPSFAGRPAAHSPQYRPFRFPLHSCTAGIKTHALFPTLLH